MIEEVLKVTINVVEFSNVNPNKNNINPYEIIVGANENHTVLNRVYLDFQLDQIPENAILISAKLNIPVIMTADEDNDNDATLIGFLVNSDPGDIARINWNNMPSFDATQVLLAKTIFKNSQCVFDILDLVENFRQGILINYGIIFVNQENIHNMAVLGGNQLDRTGLSVVVKYQIPNENLFEKTFNINYEGKEYYTDSIEIAYLERVNIFVKNLGNTKQNATIEISSNGIDFVEDNYLENILLNKVNIMTPYYYGKYLRIKIQSVDNYISSNIIIQGLYM